MNSTIVGKTESFFYYLQLPTSVGGFSFFLTGLENKWGSRKESVFFFFFKDNTCPYLFVCVFLQAQS